MEKGLMMKRNPTVSMAFAVMVVSLLRIAAGLLLFWDHVDQLPVDTHELIALIAPRYVYLGTGDLDPWSDPKGEFLAAVAAGPVFQLLGKQGLETDQMPAVNEPIVHDIGFHCHTGKHEITAFGWDQYLKFADMRLGNAH
jgi:hypothetical protein